MSRAGVRKRSDRPLPWHRATSSLSAVPARTTSHMSSPMAASLLFPTPLLLVTSCAAPRRLGQQAHRSRRQGEVLSIASTCEGVPFFMAGASCVVAPWPPWGCSATRGHAAKMESVCAAVLRFADVPVRMLASSRELDRIRVNFDAAEILLPGAPVRRVPGRSRSPPPHLRILSPWSPPLSASWLPLAAALLMFRFLCNILTELGIFSIELFARNGRPQWTWKTKKEKPC
ncbi:uncharacterized protein [Lolium perenne]|uniref:uncharacterized protein n=1 Tax=Lolium perenne TaxID=4522 RepID=UPI0021F5B399|nr:uncharacterized protein LOC127328196 [Lolium perenne]